MKTAHAQFMALENLSYTSLRSRLLLPEEGGRRRDIIYCPVFTKALAFGGNHWQPWPGTSITFVQTTTLHKPCIHKFAIHHRLLCPISKPGASPDSVSRTRLRATSYELASVKHMFSEYSHTAVLPYCMGN